MPSNQNGRFSHVVVIVPGCGGAGAVANVAMHQARELGRQMQVTLASDGFPVEKSATVECLQLSPWRFSFLRRFAHVPNEIAFAMAARHSIGRLHSQRAVSMVICHGHPAAAIAGRWLKSRLGIPYALVTHGDIFDRPKGTYDARLTWFYRRTTPPAYRDADLVIALSPHMAELAIRGGANSARVKVIPNGIDPAEIGLDDLAPRSPTGAMGALELLYVGRLSVEKGVDVLIHAASLLKGRGVAFRLRIAGDGPEARSLKQSVSETGRDDVIQFLGPIPRERLGALYRSADLVCVPSRSDTLPTAILEAMISGVPVIGSNTGGIPFLVQESETGWLVPCGDARAFADRIESVSQNPTVLTEMGRRARTWAVERFNWPAVGVRLAGEIDAVINANVRHASAGAR